jgi:glycosyltransferase involved in cell wall biosynthesis
MMKELRRRCVDASLEATISDEDDPEYVASLRSLIDEAGLGQYVRFVGRVDAAQFLSQADVMVLPSITESFGFPVIEAMACGVPVVASSIPSTNEVLGHLGWYFPVGDASAAADQVVAVLEHDSQGLQDRLLAARSRAKSYSWERNARQVVSLVEEIVVAGH